MHGLFHAHNSFRRLPPWKPSTSQASTFMAISSMPKLISRGPWQIVWTKKKTHDTVLAGMPHQHQSSYSQPRLVVWGIHGRPDCECKSNVGGCYLVLHSGMQQFANPPSFPITTHQEPCQHHKQIKRAQIVCTLKRLRRGEERGVAPWRVTHQNVIVEYPLPFVATQLSTCELHQIQGTKPHMWKICQKAI